MNRYHYIVNGEIKPPASLSYLIAECNAGRLTTATLVCIDGGDKWSPLKKHLPPSNTHTPRPRELKAVIHRTASPSSSRAATSPATSPPALLPPFAPLSVVFIVLLIISAIGTLFAAVTAADFSTTLVIIVLLLSLPSLVVYYALYVICDYLKKL